VKATADIRRRLVELERAFPVAAVAAQLAEDRAQPGCVEEQRRRARAQQHPQLAACLGDAVASGARSSAKAAANPTKQKDGEVVGVDRRRRHADEDTPTHRHVGAGFVGQPQQQIGGQDAQRGQLGVHARLLGVVEQQRVQRGEQRRRHGSPRAATG
jgi:hypothetical protein